MTARIRSGLDAIQRWSRPRERSGRARFIVSLAGVIALAGTLTVVVTATAATQVDEVSLTDVQLSALTEAATSCPQLRPARLAGQVMATTGFTPVAAGGISGLTASEWEFWKPSDSAVPTDEGASLLALAHFTCDLIGRLRVAGLPSDGLWRLAMAAFVSSLSEVILTGGVPANAAEFVANVERYTAAYDRLLGTGSPPTTDADPAAPTAPATTTTETTPAATIPTPTEAETPTEPPVVTISATAGSATPPAMATTAASTDPATSVYFAGFPNANYLSLNGSARVRDNRLDLADGAWATGSAWATATLSTTKSIQTAFTSVISGLHDGLAFVLHGDGPAALGEGGAGLGYGAVVPDAFPDSVIRPSVIVEIDATDNSPNGWDPAAPQHVAVTRNGDVSNHYVWADPQLDLDNNQPFSVWIEYDANARLLSVFMARNQPQPATPLFTYPIDLRSALGSDRAYFGFTAAAGFFDTRASVLAWSLTSG